MTSTLLNALIIASSLSFMGYGITYFTSTSMKEEFQRFGVAKAGVITAVFQLLGACGLLVGFVLHPILLISAGGLAVMMLLAVVIRIKVKDKLVLMLPAMFFMLLNVGIIVLSLTI